MSCGGPRTHVQRKRDAHASAPSLQAMTVEDLRGFDLAGYKLNEAQSTDVKLVFTRSKAPAAGASGAKATSAAPPAAKRAKKETAGAASSKKKRAAKERPSEAAAAHPRRSARHK